MSRSIKLSETHGVNPSMQVCFWCGEVIGVALMGRLKGDVEAPRKVVLDYSLCDKCKEKEKTYIHLIECVAEDNGNPPISKDAYPTGRNMWIKDAALQSIINNDSFNAIKDKRAALMLPETFEAFIHIYEDAEKEGDTSGMLDAEGIVEAEETAEASKDDTNEEKAENVKAEDADESEKNTCATQKALVEKMLENTNPKFELVVIFDKPVLFTCERLDRNFPIEGVNYYDIRHDDECRGDMAQLKDRVMVNHWGTVISKERFEPREVGGKIFTTAEGIDMDESDYNYLGETLSVSEYLEKYDELVREYCEPKEENNLEMGM